jgi:hypothetical protein
MALTAAASPRSFPQSSTGRFNAESIFMQSEPCKQVGNALVNPI